MSYLNFKKNYKNSIQLNETQFETICKFQVDTEDQKVLNMIRNHLIEKNPPIEPIDIKRLNPPSVPKPIIKKNFGEYILKIVKLIKNPSAGKGCILEEMLINERFLMQQQICEVY